MRRITDILKGVCSIGTAIIIYMTVLHATRNGEHILLYVTASVFALALTLSLFFISSLAWRVESLEKTVRRLTDDSFGEEDAERRECPYCHAMIDEGEEICPYCRNEGSPGARPAGEFFETEDPDYKGTDFSGEDYVSAYTDDKEDIL